MASKWIKKGDKVLIIAGNDKGKVGEVLARQKQRVIIQGVNVRKKHVRTKEKKPEIASIEMPIHISNVSLCQRWQRIVLPQRR
jgi:large subunit ribosomal protein L24